jgi:hypothetical protein
MQQDTKNNRLPKSKTANKTTVASPETIPDCSVFVRSGLAVAFNGLEGADWEVGGCRYRDSGTIAPVMAQEYSGRGEA